jgi:hypothetical protein
MALRVPSQSLANCAHVGLLVFVVDGGAVVDDTVDAEVVVAELEVAHLKIGYI